MTLTHPPLSQSLSLWWLPALTLLDKRGALATAMDEIGILEGFRVQSESVELRLVGNQTFHVGVAQGKYFGLLGEASPEGRTVMTQAFECAMKVLDLRPQATTWASQHLAALEWDLPGSRACQQASKILFGSWGSDLRLQDFALLVDGESLLEGTAYQAEFGVVTSLEVPARLARMVGRSEAGRQESYIDVLMMQTYPELAVFVDLMLTRTQVRPTADDFMTDVLAGLEACQEQGSDMCSLLLAQLEREGKP